MADSQSTAQASATREGDDATSLSSAERELLACAALARALEYFVMEGSESGDECARTLSRELAARTWQLYVSGGEVRHG